MQLKGTLISLGLLIILIFGAILITNFNGEKDVKIYNQEFVDSLTTADSVLNYTPPEPELLFGLPIDSFRVIEARIKPNESLSELLLPYSITHEAIFKLAERSKNIFNVNKIKAGNNYTLFLKQDSLARAKRLVYEPNEREYIVFYLDEADSFKTEVIERESIFIPKTMEGVIDASLSVTITNQGGTHELTNKFVDIFAWQIDFFRLQKGDSFKVMYEEEQIDGTPVGIHKIEAIYFNHFGNDFYAFAYDQGDGIDYFDEKGNSLRKALLKYPLEFTRISSRYSLGRYHPVQKRWKAHKGTDLAAPTGTPIRSVGDGIVLEARYAKYNGNYVKIRHNSTYTTQYLHMSKIATGIRPGVKVTTGKVIGFVGMTGLANGPHLCYRFWKNGIQVDALKVELPPSQPIYQDHIPSFNDTKEELIRQLGKGNLVEDSLSISKSF